MSESGEPRVGVFVCHCGVNIKATVDVKEVVEYAKSLPGVVYATDYPFLCADPGQEIIQEAIKEHDLDRVVVAACTPKIHENTFRNAVKAAGLSPYYMEMVNIREHCSLVHMQEPEKATKKAKDLVRAAVERAKKLEDVPTKEVEVEDSVLIIGGGIAGIQAALDLADQGFKVYLVEKEPTIGGNMARLAKTFPTDDCAM